MQSGPRDSDMSTDEDAVLSTARLRLRPLRVEDAASMVTVLADPRLYSFTGGGPPTPEVLRARYEAQVAGRSPDGSEAWHNWIVSLAPAGPEIGFVQATITSHGDAADIAWLTGVPWQGHGYAAEAGRAMLAWLVERGVADVTAHVHPAHAASARVAAAIGLVATGELEDGEQVWRLPLS